MSWAYLAISLVGALAVGFAVRPPRRQPFGVLAFTLAWIPSELPLHIAVVGVAITAVFAAFGALGSWPGLVGLVVALSSWGVLGWLAVVATRSRLVVDAALDDVHGALGPPGRGLRRASASVVEAAGRDSLSALRRREGPQPRLLGRRREAPPPRRPHPPGFVARRAPVFVYIHGGAWKIGDKREQGQPMLFELARRGWVCVTFNYRLSPRRPGRTTWSTASGRSRGFGPTSTSSAAIRASSLSPATSAGGHLSSLLALTPGEPGWQPGFEGEDTSVDACLPFYGVYDLTGDPGGMGISGPEFLRFVEKQVVQVSASDHPEVFEQASPDRWAGPSAPPMLVFHGRNDSLVPVEVARRFVDRLRERCTRPGGLRRAPENPDPFDVLASIRCRHTTQGAIRFLEAIRHRVADHGAG